MAMKSVLFVTLAVLALSAVASLADDPSDVKVLTPDNFDDEVGKDKAALVEFYAPWCGHCKKLAPEWEILATAFKKTPNVLIAKVDCDSHKDLCSRFDVSGYPTIKFFEANSLKPSPYNGGRTADDLIEFVNKETGSSVKSAKPASDVVVLDPSNFDKIVLDSTKDVLVEFYAPWCGHCKSLAPHYEKLATAFKSDSDVVIANCDADAHRSLGEKFGVSGFPTLKWFPKETKEGEDVDAGRTLEELVKYVNEKARKNRLPSGLLSAEAGKVEELDALAAKFVAASAAEKKSILAEVEKAAADLEGAEAGFAKVYVKVIQTALKKGDDYFKTELARLARVLSGALHPKKVDEFTIKKNILESFSATSAE
eukprot:TRINITY_DN77_c0_g1_i1.p1 TRINITY_DN77_c0_g1~~TRINITY_DN77_c0_g1_i1.p1  ORF type:complete len:368 (-),score=112.07 TRINITY_DN77_c0_g1_i1:493-1596(-)